MSYRYGKRMVAILLLLTVLCLGMGTSGCALPVGSTGEARILAQARQDYRNASLVVSGTCLQTHVNAKGVNCYDLTVEDVLAGQAAAGDVIHCTSPMTEGKSYLLYLQKGEDVPHTEDMQGYTLVSGQPLALSQGCCAVGWAGGFFGNAAGGYGQIGRHDQRAFFHLLL